MNAVQAYSPRIKLMKPVQMNDIANFIAGRSGRVKGSIKDVLSELHETFMHYLCIGKPVKLEEVGIFRPVMANDGTIRISFLPDPTLISKMNKKGVDAKIKCQDMIGTTSEEKIVRWNKEHPDDPVL